MTSEEFNYIKETLDDIRDSVSHDYLKTISTLFLGAAISLGTAIVMFRYNKSEERYKAKAKIVGNIYGVAYDLKIYYNNFLVTRYIRQP